MHECFASIVRGLVLVYKIIIVLKNRKKITVTVQKIQTGTTDVIKSQNYQYYSCRGTEMLFVFKHLLQRKLQL